MSNEEIERLKKIFDAQEPYIDEDTRELMQKYGIDSSMGERYKVKSI